MEEVDGDPSYASLSEVPAKIDIVNVFRRSDALREIVEQVVALGAKTIWAQLGVENEDARWKALEAGFNYAENLCLCTEHERLFARSLEG